jgi:hypothetical protein
VNEKILLLAKQADLQVESWMTNPPKPFQILGTTEQFEKFAELVVQECIKRVQLQHFDEARHDDWSRGYAEALEVATADLHKRFGVM